MARTRSRYRSRPGSRSGSSPAGRVPVRVVAAAAGGVLVLLNGLLVLAPVVGLVGAAASAGPLLDVPTASIAVVVVLGYLLALALAAAALVCLRPVVAWALAAAAWAVSLAVSVWPVVATADAAVDSVRDIVPWILDLVSRVG